MGEDKKAEWKLIILALLWGRVSDWAVYRIVEDPKSAVFSFFGALIGVRGHFGFTRAANLRPTMSEKLASTLGELVQVCMDDVKVVQQRLCKAWIYYW